MAEASANAPTITEITDYLDTLDFGPYVPGDNDCDVMAVKAREALKLKWPGLQTGITVLFGLSLLGRLITKGRLTAWFIAGHGILALKCFQGQPYLESFYYDCTTATGKDHSRFRTKTWLNAWVHYLTRAYLVVYKHTFWGDYTPAIKR